MARRCVPCLPCPEPNQCGQQCAAIEMRPHLFRKVRAAARAEMRAVAEKVGAELLLAIALRTGRAFGNRVREAIFEQQRSLLVAEQVWASAIEMCDPVAVDGHGVAHRNGLLASRARGFTHLFRQEDRTIARRRRCVNQRSDHD